MKSSGSKKQKESWDLRLYVAGQTPKSITALANLKKLCQEHLKDEYNIEMIDLVRNPQLARKDQIHRDSDFGAESAPTRSRKSSAIFPTPRKFC